MPSHSSSERCIPHSTFSTSLPQTYMVFPITPGFAPKYAFLAHFRNRLTFNHLSSGGHISHPTSHIPHDEKPSFEARNMPFRSPFSYLSHLESLAIATRKVPNATGGPSFSAFWPFRFAFSHAISAKNATQVFCQFFLLLVVECGVGMGLLNFENSTNGIMEKPQI